MKYIEKKDIKNSINDKLSMLPVKIILIYLLVTIVLYAINADRPETKHPFLLYPYLIVSYLLLYFGFKSSTIKGRNKVQSNRINANSIFGFSSQTYSFFLIVSVILLHITLNERTGSFWFNFNSLRNLGRAYLENYEFVINRQGSSLVEWARAILAPITLLYLALGITCWKKLSIGQKILMVYVALGNIFMYFLSGVNKMLADTIIMLFIYALIGIVRSDNLKAKLGGFLTAEKKIKKFVIVMTVIAIIFICVFTVNIGSRVGAETFTFDGILDYTTQYFANGYIALDCSFEQPFESTFGFGSSMYLLQSTRGWFDTDFFYERTYLTKNEVLFGIDQSKNWSTIFVWIGNDISLLGAMIAMYFIGRFFGKVWMESIYQDNPYSLVLCGLMTQLCFYIPANNQIVQTFEALAGLLFMLLLRGLKKKIRFVFSHS